MYNIKIDYMRNHFHFFVKFFYLPTSGVPAKFLTGTKLFGKIFWKIFNNTLNLVNL